MAARRWRGPAPAASLGVQFSFSSVAGLHILPQKAASIPAVARRRDGRTSLAAGWHHARHQNTDQRIASPGSVHPDRASGRLLCHRAPGRHACPLAETGNGQGPVRALARQQRPVEPRSGLRRQLQLRGQGLPDRTVGRKRLGRPRESGPGLRRGSLRPGRLRRHPPRPPLVRRPLAAPQEGPPVRRRERLRSRPHPRRRGLPARRRRLHHLRLGELRPLRLRRLRVLEEPMGRSSQYTMYWVGSKVEADVGQSCSAYDSPCRRWGSGTATRW